MDATDSAPPSVRSAPPPARADGEAGFGARAFYWFCWSLCLLLLSALYRMRRHNHRALPRTGPLLIAANHQSHLDPPAIGTCFTHRPLHFVARGGLFKSRAFGSMIRALNSIPIKEGGASDVAAIKEVLARLERGHAVLIFPEGSRSPDGELQDFKRGVALLVKRAGCPVVPAAIEGAFHAWPRSRLVPRLLGGRVDVMIGEPIPHAELMSGGADAALARVKSEIAGLQQKLRDKRAFRRPRW